MAKTKGMFGAVGRGDTATVRKLLAQNPKVLNEYFINKSWLHWAAQGGNVEIMEVLLDAGAPVDQVTKDSADTALAIAAGQGHHDACKWLLGHGAEVNFGLGKSATPIFRAIYSRSLKLVKFFVERGADLSATFGPRPKIDVIRFAKENGSPEIVSFLRKQMDRHES